MGCVCVLEEEPSDFSHRPWVPIVPFHVTCGYLEEIVCNSFLTITIAAIKYPDQR